MLQVTVSNRIETLFESLLDSLVDAPESPFATEQIIVPSQGMRRRIELSVADRFGICCNVRFSFLAAWLWRQIGQVIPVQEASPFAAPVLAWRIFRIFDEEAFVAPHPRLAGYLSRADPRMRYDLACQTASLLEQYITYRADWLAAWADGKRIPMPAAGAARQADQEWQAALWRRIAGDLGTGRQHPSEAFFRAVESLGPAAPGRAGLPEVAHVFCLPTVPPLHLDILRQFGRWIDLRLYVLNPCREYWFEIVDRRRLSYLAAHTEGGDESYHEVGNRLLAAWGKQSQAHMDLLFDDAGQASIDDSRFASPGTATLLCRVQEAMLNLRELEPGSVGLADEDRSVEVHVCHSLTRELEVLQDQLLSLFGGPNPPRPADVLVVTPDLEGAAPLIEAVFGNAPAGRRIAYALTGRRRSSVNPAARALLDLLSLATSRFPASAVIALLQQPIVARRFAVAAPELESIHAWMRESGIRWGVDAAHRGRLDLPASERYAFSDGLNRLFLAYALPAAGSLPFNERLPTGHPEGSEAAALGCFWQFMQQLGELQGALTRPKTAEEWIESLRGILDTFLAPVDDELDDLREMQESIAELQDNMRRGSLRGELPLEVVRAALEALLDDPARGGVPTGALTFSSMTSLRNLPYRIVCVVGLNDGAYPSAGRATEFDLMALDPRRGDRQRRIDERNLFLDLLLAARDRLYLSYTGRNVRDNSLLPPSVLISDLVDYLVPAIAADPASAATLHGARRRLIVEHPLQAFSPDCFAEGGDPRLKSFNHEYCDALQRSMQAPAPAGTQALEVAAADDSEEDAVESAQAFFKLPLTDAEEAWRDVSLDQLLRFFRNPCRYLLQQRLGIRLSQGEEELLDDEPFLPDWPARAGLAERLLPLYLDGGDDAQIRALALAGTEYPPGRMGELLLERELEMLGGFARGLLRESTAACLPPHHGTLDFDLDGQRWRLSGAFGNLRPGGLVLHRYDDARAADYLAGWLQHLFLNAAPPAGVLPRTCWHSRDGRYLLHPCSGALEHLRELLALYRRGLREPLHFFPKSAWSYMANAGSRHSAIGTWRRTRQRAFGEDRDPAYRLALRGIADPLDEEFKRCAAAVFAPLLEHLEDPRL